MPRGRSKGRMGRSSSKRRMQGGRKGQGRNPKEESFFHKISSDSGQMGNMKEDEY